MGKFTPLLVIVQGDSVQICGPETHGIERDGSMVLRGELANWLKSNGFVGSLVRCVVALRSEDILCGSFPLPSGSRTVGNTELCFIAEQFVPLSAEDAAMNFSRHSRQVWFASTSMAPLEQVLDILQNAGITIVGVTPLVLVALAGLGLQPRSAILQMTSSTYGDDCLRFDEQQQILEWTHSVSEANLLEPASTAENANVLSSPFPDGDHKIEWSLSTCNSGLQLITSSKLRPTIDFLTDARLSRYRANDREKQAQAWILLIVTCLIAITISCQWRSTILQKRSAGLYESRAGLLAQALPHLSEERQTILMARSHRNGLKKQVAASAQLKRPADPERHLVRVLKSLAEQRISVEEIRAEGGLCRVTLPELASESIESFQRQLLAKGLKATRLESSNGVSSGKLSKWMIEAQESTEGTM